MTPPRSPTAEEIAGPEWAAWWRLAPLERWQASQRLWAEYVALGGSLDPEIDTQSPFWCEEDVREFARRAADARTSSAHLQSVKPDAPRPG